MVQEKSSFTCYSTLTCLSLLQWSSQLSYSSLIIIFHHILSVLQVLVHISTAYANCDKPFIEEMIYNPPVDPQKLIDAFEWVYLINHSLKKWSTTLQSTPETHRCIWVSISDQPFIEEMIYNPPVDPQKLIDAFEWVFLINHSLKEWYTTPRNSYMH